MEKKQKFKKIFSIVAATLLVAAIIGFAVFLVSNAVFVDKNKKNNEETTTLPEKVTDIFDIAGVDSDEDLDKKNEDNLSSLEIPGENEGESVSPFTTDELKQHISDQSKEWNEIISNHVGFSYDEWSNNYDGVRLYIQNIIDSFNNKEIVNISDWEGYSDQDLRDWLIYCIYHNVRFDVNEFVFYGGGPYKDVITGFLEMKYPILETSDIGQVYVERLESFIEINNGQELVNYIIYFENKKTNTINQVLCNIGSDQVGCHISIYDIREVKDE